MCFLNTFLIIIRKNSFCSVLLPVVRWGSCMTNQSTFWAQDAIRFSKQTEIFYTRCREENVEYILLGSQRSDLLWIWISRENNFIQKKISLQIVLFRDNVRPHWLHNKINWYSSFGKFSNLKCGSSDFHFIRNLKSWLNASLQGIYANNFVIRHRKDWI